MAFLVPNRRDGRNFFADEHQTNRQPAKVQNHFFCNGKTFDGVAQEKLFEDKKIARLVSFGRLKAGEQYENSRRGHHRTGRDVRDYRRQSNSDKLYFAGNSSSTIFIAILSKHADNFNVAGC